MHRTEPISSLRHNGVVEVWQFWHVGIWSLAGWFIATVLELETLCVSGSLRIVDS